LKIISNRVPQLGSALLYALHLTLKLLANFLIFFFQLINLRFVSRNDPRPSLFELLFIVHLTIRHFALKILIVVNTHRFAQYSFKLTRMQRFKRIELSSAFAILRLKTITSSLFFLDGDARQCILLALFFGQKNVKQLHVCVGVLNIKFDLASYSDWHA